MLLMVLSGAYHIFKPIEVIDELDLSSVKFDHNEFNGCTYQGIVGLHGHPNRQKAVQEEPERYSTQKKTTHKEIETQNLNRGNTEYKVNIVKEELNV